MTFFLTQSEVEKIRNLQKSIFQLSHANNEYDCAVTIDTMQEAVDEIFKNAEADFERELGAKRADPEPQYRSLAYLPGFGLKTQADVLSFLGSTETNKILR